MTYFYIYLTIQIPDSDWRIYEQSQKRVKCLLKTKDSTTLCGYRPAGCKLSTVSTKESG